MAMLIEVIERRSPVTNRKSVVYVCRCDACEARIEASLCRIKRYPHRHFCDVKCMGRHKREHPEAWPNNSAARNTPEACAKAMATRSRRIAAGEIKHSWTGRHHSEETKRHLSEVSKGDKRSGANNGMFGRHHSEEARAKMSEKKAQAIVEGRFRAYGTRNKTGWYESTKTGRRHFFRSGWEEATMKFLDNDPMVVTWDYECVRIPYCYDDHKRWYVPDFIVSFVDGTRDMWEVKPKQFLETERVRLTAAAGEAYCKEHGFGQYRHITKQVMGDLGIVV